MASRYRVLCVDCEHIHGKLVEIGVAELDVQTLKVTRSFQALVFNAEKHKLKSLNLPPWFTDLTGITNEEFHSKALPLSDVRNHIIKRFGKKKAWYAWGEDDELLGDIFLGPFVNYALVRRHFCNPENNINIMDTLPDHAKADLKAHRALDDALALCRRMQFDLIDVRSLSPVE